jgi:autotransporter passenger strand-loop-strand repeat protein
MRFVHAGRKATSAQQIKGDLSLAVITAPPNQNGLVLDQGDLLLVERQGLATNTVINAGGREDVIHGGVSDHTIINVLGVERVDEFSSSNNTVIHRGGREIVEGVSNHTDIMGGREIVEGSGRAYDTTIGNSGRLEVLYGASVANNVTFADQGRNAIELSSPNRLTGTIANWHVGDFVDLLDTRATSVIEHGNVLTVTYEVGSHSRQVTYTLTDQQPDTHFALRNDGHGGTDIVLVAGVQPSHHGGFLI